MAASLLSLIIFMAASFINQCHANPRTDIVARICGNVHVQNVSNYFKSYSMISDKMEDDMYRNKFALGDIGKPPDRMYALAQCMEDLTYDECAMCFTQIISLVPGCFPQTGARIYFDGCFVRIENYSFFEEALGDQDTKRCSADKNRGPEYNDAVRKVLDKILQDAPSSQGYARIQASTKGISAYGMSICWRTLDENSCASCLTAAAEAALVCLPSAEARILNAGCFLRYADYSLANDPSSQARQEIVSYITYVMGVVVACLLAIAVGVCVGKITYKRKNRQETSPKGIEIQLEDYSALLASTDENTNILKHDNFFKSDKKQKNEYLTGPEVDLLLEDRLQFLQFKHATLKAATENFSDGRRLGRGGFGEVYMGILRDGREIAVKRLFVSGKSRMREICNEMDIISRAQHKNLVRFLGCCFTSVDSLLVYEYLANRSLDLMLFDPAKKKELDWKKRIMIITGTAEGLEYLHTDCQVRIIHRDIKASNVLLDVKHKPKISDFGLARFHSCDQSLVSTAIAGTLGYMAPEYIAKGRLTEKVDVYSFGVLVIEIVTGVENNKYHSEETYETLVTSIWKHYQSKTVGEIIDKSIRSEEDMEEIGRVVQIGLLCTQESPHLRPSMSEVVQMLRKIDVQLPIPSKPPFTDEHMELGHLGSDRRLSSPSSHIFED